MKNNMKKIEIADKNLNEVIARCVEYRKQIDALTAIKTELENQLKEYMTRAGVQKIEGILADITYIDVNSSRFDVSAFKVSNPEEYKKNLVFSTNKRFSIRAKEEE